MPDRPSLGDQGQSESASKSLRCLSTTPAIAIFAFNQPHAAHPPAPGHSGLSRGVHLNQLETLKTSEY